VVIAWVLSKGPTVIPIPSARTEQHARDSVAAGSLVLGPDDLRALDEARFSRA
jgi:aryl-alcohol dehydrogenase-like predicted oxidoreductase